MNLEAETQFADGRLDPLLHRVGIEAVHASMARLGLTGTVITADLRTAVNSIGQDAGFADWAAMSAWGAAPHSPEEEAQVIRRMLASAALTPSRTIPDHTAGYGDIAPADLVRPGRAAVSG